MPDVALLDRTVLMHSTNGSHRYPMAAATICIDGREYRQEVAVLDRLPRRHFTGNWCPFDAPYCAVPDFRGAGTTRGTNSTAEAGKKSYAAVTRAQRLQESTAQGNQPPANTDLSGGGDPVIEVPPRTTTGASGEASTEIAEGSLLPANTEQSGGDCDRGATKNHYWSWWQSLYWGGCPHLGWRAQCHLQGRPSLELQPGTLFPFTEDLFSPSQPPEPLVKCCEGSLPPQVSCHGYSCPIGWWQYYLVAMVSWVSTLWLPSPAQHSPDTS